MGLFDDKSSDEKNKELLNECEKYGLEDWQKELVLKGLYDPWDYEEDEKLEEEDYYFYEV